MSGEGKERVEGASLISRGEQDLIGAKRVDQILGVMSVVLWVAVAVICVVMLTRGGVDTSGPCIFVVAIAGFCWASVVRAWIKERSQLIKGVLADEALKEIVTLRESIEKLRKVLES